MVEFDGCFDGSSVSILAGEVWYMQVAPKKTCTTTMVVVVLLIMSWSRLRLVVAAREFGIQWHN